MSSPQELFQQFASSFRRDGSADPCEYLAQVDGLDREELEVLIEAFLLRTPRRSWDESSFRESIAERALARASGEEMQADEESLGWSVLLPALRTRAQLKRKTVVERLASALGFPGREERVAAYYHRMEQGQLPPSGVSSKVLEALAEIVDSTAGDLRRAGEASWQAGEAGGEVFTRVGAPANDLQPPPLESADLWQPDSPDQLDLLFTGGD